MHIWGLHILDAGIIFLYIAIILWLGRWAGRKTKDTGDFFLAGRKLGKTTQFFLNFGCSTNADQAVAVSREIYRQASAECGSNSWFCSSRRFTGSRHFSSAASG